MLLPLLLLPPTKTRKKRVCVRTAHKTKYTPQALKTCLLNGNKQQQQAADNI